MLFVISQATITVAVLIIYFTLLRNSDEPEDGSQLEWKHVDDKTMSEIP